MTEANENIAAALDAAGRIRRIADSLRDAELQDQVSDLLPLLSKLRVQIEELEARNVELRRGLTQKEEVPELRKRFERRESVYWLREPAEGEEPGPYCPKCLDVEGRLFLLTELPASFHHMFKYSCPSCQDSF